MALVFGVMSGVEPLWAGWSHSTLNQLQLQCWVAAGRQHVFSLTGTDSSVLSLRCLLPAQVQPVPWWAHLCEGNEILMYSTYSNVIGHSRNRVIAVSHSVPLQTLCQSLHPQTLGGAVVLQLWAALYDVIIKFVLCGSPCRFSRWSLMVTGGRRRGWRRWAVSGRAPWRTGRRWAVRLRQCRWIHSGETHAWSMAVIWETRSFKLRSSVTLNRIE